MDKYKKTSGLNYLSENSYKGDGSPGMVMGIASDARATLILTKHRSQLLIANTVAKET